jgi:hypothetical protein
MRCQYGTTSREATCEMSVRDGVRGSYFLPILSGQKAAVFDSVEGWLSGRRMVCRWHPWSFQGVDSHRRPDGWTEERQGQMMRRAGSGEASFNIPMSFHMY